MTDTDTALRPIVSADGVHVVHVWAPWCDNSLNELAPVWTHADALDADSVTFVTVWNEGESGADVLAQYGVEVDEVVVPGPKPENPDRRLTLLGVPVSWIPTTLVFNRNGLLAYALSYGEATAEQVMAAVADARREW